MSNPSALQRWLGGGLKTVMLPTGTIFAYSIPPVEDLVARGLIPEHLRKVALQFAASAVDPLTMDTDSLSELLQFMRALIAQSLRYLWTGEQEPIEAWEQFAPGDKWEPVTLTAADLQEAALDADDYAALFNLVGREATGVQITAQSLAEHGLLDRAEADQIISASRTATVPGWSSFRSERRRASAGAAGAAVGRKAVGAGGDQRSRRRTRA